MGNDKHALENAPRAKRLLTERQMLFAESFSGDFRHAVQLVIDQPFTDLFDDYLSSWAMVLGILAHEVYVAVVDLLRKHQIRAAYMLGRPLLDYHITLRYYYVDAEPVMTEWRKTKNAKKIQNAIRRTKAYQNWQNGKSKFLSKIRDFPLEREEYSSEFLEELRQEHEVFSTNVKHMCDLAGDDDHQSRLYYGTHLVQSGFLHGDQSIIFDVAGDTEKREVYWESRALSSHTILTNALENMTAFMKTIRLIKGWCYAEVYSERRFAQMFLGSQSPR